MGALTPRVLRNRRAKEAAALEAALDRYRDATNEVVRMMARCAPAERAGGMSQHPRLTRYHAMRAVYDALHSGKTALGDPRLAFSVLNLSYDYDDAWAECEAQVTGFKGARYKSFKGADALREARDFIGQAATSSGGSRRRA